MPTAPPPDVAAVPVVGFVVTVLPLAVVTGAGGVAARALFGAVRGAVFGARRSGTVAFLGGASAGAAGVAAGTSFSAGCAVLSRPASAKSRFSVLSAPSAPLSGPFFAS